MRVFVAIPISKELQGGILEWVTNFQFPISNFQPRWLQGKNLHVTLVPPWQTREWKAESEKLRAVKGAPFKIRFNQISLGPNPREPRLIWAGGPTPQELPILKSNIEKALGKQPEDRKFRMHITLARMRTADKSADYNPLSNQLPQTVGWEEEVKSFVLMESHLSPKGADYEVLEEYGLKKD
ncbi:MAG: RNA 2',3'-cyclic phosphodiesterase [Patescibacteria group bacterium]|nr:RNA 2',3'-cyclic phosphodiesterase [Patescibacteria group bacterium]